MNDWARWCQTSLTKSRFMSKCVPRAWKLFFSGRKFNQKVKGRLSLFHLEVKLWVQNQALCKTGDFFLHLQITKVAELKHEGIWFMSLWKDKQTEVQLSSIFWVVFCSERSRYVGAQAPWNSETWHLWNTWLVRGHGESYLRLLAWLTLFTSRLCKNHSSLILILHFTSYNF